MLIEEPKSRMPDDEWKIRGDRVLKAYEVMMRESVDEQEDLGRPVTIPPLVFCTRPGDLYRHLTCSLISSVGEERVNHTKLAGPECRAIAAQVCQKKRRHG